jgi:[acyl-carrier-protein] S-malonyltransferase
VIRAIEIAKEKGAKRGLLLPVSAPFHCSLMDPAAEEMGKALAEVDMLAPAMPVISNVTAGPVTDVEEIRHLLVQQVTGVVRWRESIMRLSEIGVIQLVECGTGKVLSGLAKRIDPSLGVTNIETPDDLYCFIQNHI